ncbi:hypothetical protein [Actinoallomurus iriomotensis]|uniref:DUF892 family protein n=1 Tax=Actinoallomurus iriomotensis TaxID=478107 RepID=A0A9W6VWF1_9ACTN|nr:hypothetical protein [Actinoallomurus iriomotensis]GLY80706.1 hypothetical protein Airi01_089730 [Actinoallomurus iriomotensis]
MDSDSKQTGRTAEADPGLLGVYLNDHLAGATLGSELSARLASAHRDSEDGAVLERLSTEIREDRAALIELMAALEVPVRQYKVLLGWAAEKAGRFKPNGRLLERSPLSSLEELEAMTLGVVGKSACWRVLRTLADHDDRLDPERLDDLLRRAKRQAETLEELRLRAGARLATSAA